MKNAADVSDTYSNLDDLHWDLEYLKMPNRSQVAGTIDRQSAPSATDGSNAVSIRMLAEKNVRLKHLIGLLFASSNEQQGEAITTFEKQCHKVMGKTLVQLNTGNVEVCMESVKRI